MAQNRFEGLYIELGYEVESAIVLTFKKNCDGWFKGFKEGY
jgi:hypothetical protein